MIGSRVERIMLESELSPRIWRINYLRETVELPKFAYEMTWDLVIELGPEKIRDNHYRMLGSLA